MRRRLLLVLVAAVAVLLPAVPAHAAADPGRPKQWGLDRIGAEAAWKVANGAGVIVAVVDSGVDLQHEDLVSQLVPGRDFVQDDDVPQDEYGHGTHVAGIVAATAGNGVGVAGVAPGAKVMPVRVLDAEGSGTLDDVIAGVRWAVQHGAHVVNLSLGEDTQALLGPSFGDVVDEVWEAGAIPVVAAGNQFVTDSGFSQERALVVSATNREDGKPTYSSGTGAARWGISAPGGELPQLGAEGSVLSTYWNGAGPNRYAYLSGTSQAAPHVSGALAVLLSTGRFSPQQAVDRLLQTAKDLGPRGKDGSFGAGRLDLAAAIAPMAPAPPGAAAAAAPGSPRPAPAPVAPMTTTTAAAPFAAPAPVQPPMAGPTTTAGSELVADAVVLGERQPPALVVPADGGADDGADDGRGPLAWTAAALLVLAGAASYAARRRVHRTP